MALTNFILTHSLHQWLHSGKSTLELKVVSSKSFKEIIFQEALAEGSVFKSCFRSFRNRHRDNGRSLKHPAHESSSEKKLLLGPLILDVSPEPGPEHFQEDCSGCFKEMAFKSPECVAKALVKGLSNG